MEVKDRIKAFCKAKNISVSAFERKCGLSNGYINNIKGGISLNKLAEILRIYSDLSKDWLLYESGPMIVSNNEFNTELESSNLEIKEPKEPNGNNQIIDVIVSQQNTIEKQQNTIERLTKIIENMVTK